MKMMEGACARACANRSRTRAGPTPTNISMKSEPLMDRNGTLASPAVALARSVLPAARAHGVGQAPRLVQRARGARTRARLPLLARGRCHHALAVQA